MRCGKIAAAARGLAAATPKLAAVGAVDLVGLGGFGAVVHGIWQIYPPLAWIIGGAAAMALSWVLSPTRQNSETRS